MPRRNKFPTLKGRKLQRAMKTLPLKIGEITVQHFQESFKNESFDGKKWPNRKKESRRGKRTEKGQRGLLVQSGSLLNSIEVSEVTSNSVTIESGYVVGKKSKWNLAQIHNEGLPPVPQRKFLGKSKTLDRKINRLVTKEIRRALN